MSLCMLGIACVLSSNTGGSMHPSAPIVLKHMRSHGLLGCTAAFVALEAGSLRLRTGEAVARCRVSKSGGDVTVLPHRWASFCRCPETAGVAKMLPLLEKLPVHPGKVADSCTFRYDWCALQVRKT